jgi:hypothetical protein
MNGAAVRLTGASSLPHSILTGIPTAKPLRLSIYFLFSEDSEDKLGK